MNSQIRDFNSPQETEELTHRIRLSIDISSIKDHNFRGVVYAKYMHYPQLGIKS